MATRIELSFPEARIERIEQNNDGLTLHVSELFLFISLTGSREQTQWRQSGTLTVEQVEIEGPLPGCPCTLEGGDLHDHAFTYRDLAPLPIDSHGQVGCTLRIAGQTEPLVLRGERIHLELTGERRYVGHVRPD